mgnify:FL=1
MEIKIGYALAKPVETQAQCDAYTTMVEAINAHNAVCAVGDTLWSIEEETDCYKVADGGTVPDPEDLPKPEPTLKEQLETLKAAQADTDAMTVDQEYRLSLLELGITDETT